MKITLLRFSAYNSLSYAPNDTKFETIICGPHRRRPIVFEVSGLETEEGRAVSQTVLGKTVIISMKCGHSTLLSVSIESSP